MRGYHGAGNGLWRLRPHVPQTEGHVGRSRGDLHAIRRPCQMQDATRVSSQLSHFVWNQVRRLGGGRCMLSLLLLLLLLLLLSSFIDHASNPTSLCLLFQIAFVDFQRTDHAPELLICCHDRSGDRRIFLLFLHVPSLLLLLLLTGCSAEGSGGEVPDDDLEV